ncbi:MAG: glycoside hydrolase [Eubacterium sp.]
MKVDFYSAKNMQTLYGWGSSACWWSQYCPVGETADEIARLLYSKDGLNLNIYRYNIGGGTDEGNCRVENPWRRTESFLLFDSEREAYEWDFSRDKNAVSFMKKSLALGNIDTLILFCNSPHYSQCSTGQASGSLLMHTCNIPKMNYKKFVDYVLDVTQHFLDDGIRVDYISPINEPQWKWGGAYVWQEGCHYELEELIEIYRLFAEQIIERKIPVKLYGPESGEMLGLTPQYLEAIYSDRSIMQVMDVFAYHSYHSDNYPQVRYDFKKKIVEKYSDIRFDMSEWCELPNKSHTKNFKGALITARIIGQDIICAGAQSWTSWVACNNISVKEDGYDYSDAALSASPNFEEWTVNERYYGIAHFSRYIPVGSVALDIGFYPSDDKNDFNMFAFKTPNGETVLVIINEGREQSVELYGDFNSMRVITSSQNEKLNERHFDTFCSKIISMPDTIQTVILK